MSQERARIDALDTDPYFQLNGESYEDVVTRAIPLMGEEAARKMDPQELYLEVIAQTQTFYFDATSVWREVYGAKVARMSRSELIDYVHGRRHSTHRMTIGYNSSKK